MALSDSDRHHSLVRRIQSARADLAIATDPEKRSALLEELGTATRELTDLILTKEGRLKSPLE